MDAYYFATFFAMIEEIDYNRYGNTSIASGSFGEVSIALYRPSSTGNNTSIGGVETGGSWSYAAVKTIRNAVLASSVEGTSLASSWGFAATGAHSGTGTDDGITANTTSNSSSAKPPQLSREAFAELAALRSLASGKHSCIVPLLAAYPSQSGLSRGMGLSLAFPYCPSGHPAPTIQHSRGRCLRWDDTRRRSQGDISRHDVGSAALS